MNERKDRKHVEHGSEWTACFSGKENKGRYFSLALADMLKHDEKHANWS